MLRNENSPSAYANLRAFHGLSAKKRSDSLLRNRRNLQTRLPPIPLRRLRLNLQHRGLSPRRTRLRLPFTRQLLPHALTPPQDRLIKLPPCRWILSMHHRHDVHAQLDVPSQMRGLDPVS